MKNQLEKILIGILSVILVIGASAISVSAASISTTTIAAVDNNGVTALAGVASDLTQEEVKMLLFMREEEKLARDVYTAMYALWGQPVFQNIAASEQKHMDAVKFLLERYDLTDPILAPGSFSDPNLQALYDQLIAQGSISLSDALKVGAAIEEIDILDLEKRLEQTDNTDIQLVFDNLMKGSYNHLNAFTRTFTARTGATYQPQYLSSDAYTAIVTGQVGNSFGNGNKVQGPGRGGPRWSR